MKAETISKTPILDRIIEVMQDVVAAELPLYMGDFYKAIELPSIDANIHTCGTAACICGYAALDPKTVEMTHLTGASLFTRPRRIWKLVQNELIVNYLTFSYETASEITRAFFAGTAGSRRYGAFCAELPQKLRTMKHLTINDPSAKDALEFLITVRDWIYTGEVK